MRTERFGWERTDVGARGEAQNTAKRAPNGQGGDVLWRMYTVQKNRKVSVTNMVTRENQGEQ